MKKISLFFLTLFTLTSCQEKPKIKLNYVEDAKLIKITSQEFVELFSSDLEMITYIHLQDNDGCASCIGGTISDLQQYAIDHHFNIYDLSFDFSSSTFKEEYTLVAEATRRENDNEGLEYLNYQDGKMVIPLLPRLLYSSNGYIGFNIAKDFIQKLDATFYTEK